MITEKCKKSYSSTKVDFDVFVFILIIFVFLHVGLERDQLNIRKELDMLIENHLNEIIRALQT